ncbi:transglycosylase SLT domain-containing protein [Alicyclobacillus macrosporangiidus]|uniref:Transglycosylase SLT domain-containing protein n=1 Tax=Alicyclobacillus macrosporangiidus TaxID=392015 RepID=A0A1I7KCR7_9BACL|nr:transglycosylase SLT domain-containing protein [Alicyclobacillus macrosporangiidus]SFU95224.1 Transglycosylase SLT domain-containing protein [Alicyclobacillus macrosporangiidus]
MTSQHKRPGLWKRITNLPPWKLLLLSLAAGMVVLGPLLIGYVLISVVSNTAGTFYLGAFTGVHLDGDQAQWSQVDSTIQQEYQAAADHWQDGLDESQKEIVRSYQLDLPASVLLTLGKFIDGYQSPNQAQRAMDYYQLVKPQYTWVKAQGETIHKFWTTRTVCDENGCTTESYIATEITYFTVWELRKAEVWDGTFTSEWQTVTIGGFTDGVGTETITPQMVDGNMQYDWTRLYQAAAKYGFQKSDVDPLWFDAIFAMQYSQYEKGDMFAWLRDPKVAQWGPMFGVTGPIAPSGPPHKSGYLPNQEQVKSWVDQALQADDLPMSWEPYILDIVAHESGGDPYAYNPQGIDPMTGGPGNEHAEGIMQTLPSTFQEFAVPGHEDIWNPVDNLMAALRYIEVRYKVPWAINGIGNSLPYRGY